MNEMNNGENNNQNIEQPNLNENQNMVQPGQQYVQPVQEPPKKSNALVIILTILVIGLAGFIVYDKVIKKEEPKEPEKQGEVDKPVETNEEKKSIVPENYSLVNDSGKNYLVVKNGNNYEVVYEFTDIVNKFAGIYNNKAYFSTGDAIKTIDLLEKKLNIKNWIESDCEDFCEGISEAQIIDNQIYFKNDNGGSVDLYVLSLFANNFNEAQKIATVDLVEMAFDSTNIYYMVDNNIYKYDLLLRNSEKLVASTNSDFKYAFGKIIYTGKNEILVYDVSTKNATTLVENVVSKSGGLYGIADATKNSVYYLDGKGNIKKYSQSNNEEYYKIADIKCYSAFVFYDDDNFKISYDTTIKGCSNHKSIMYISSKSEVSQLPTREVKMLDGSIKNIAINKFE